MLPAWDANSTVLLSNNKLSYKMSRIALSIKTNLASSAIYNIQKEREKMSELPGVDSKKTAPSRDKTATSDSPQLRVAHPSYESAYYQDQ